MSEQQHPKNAHGKQREPSFSICRERHPPHPSHSSSYVLIPWFLSSQDIILEFPLAISLSQTHTHISGILGGERMNLGTLLNSPSNRFWVGFFKCPSTFTFQHIILVELQIYRLLSHCHLCCCDIWRRGQYLEDSNFYSPFFFIKTRSSKH